jgi:hypothetical protein
LPSNGTAAGSRPAAEATTTGDRACLIHPARRSMAAGLAIAGAISAGDGKSGSVTDPASTSRGSVR